MSGQRSSLGRSGQYRALQQPRPLNAPLTCPAAGLAPKQHNPEAQYLACTRTENQNRAAYFRKAITAPQFASERVLARDAFQFAELWLKRYCTAALPYWKQAHAYYQASQHLPPQSSPLTSYYSFLNSVKALLIVKKQKFTDRHGVTGAFESSKRALCNEKIKIQGGGVISTLSRYVNEKESSTEHSLTDILSNLPFIHRAFRFTFRSHPELFIPVENVIYRKHPTPRHNYIWISAQVKGRYADKRTMRTLPREFEQDAGYDNDCVIRTKNRIKWVGNGAANDDRLSARRRLERYHRECRQHLVYIAASPDLWYLKRAVAKAKRLDRYTLTLTMAAMHRLSELSRYDPKGLSDYLAGRPGWLLTEFIELAPAQFIDELVCEMTSLEFGQRGIRPTHS